MSDYDDRGDVVIWKNDSDNPKAPNAKGTVIAHRDIKEGEQVDIALWKNQSDNPKAPVMKGKIGDRQKKGQSREKSNEPERGGADFDDDIPFASLDWRF